VGDVRQGKVGVHIDESWLARNVGVSPFLGKEHFPADSVSESCHVGEATGLMSSTG
jgi:hypothetical protein